MDNISITKFKYEFKNSHIDSLCNELRTLFVSKQSNFISIAKAIHRIKQEFKKEQASKSEIDNLDNEAELKDISGLNNHDKISLRKLLKDMFGLSDSSISRYAQMLDKFCESYTTSDGIQYSDLKPEYSLYSQSKLQELLTVPQDTLNNLIQSKKLYPELTVKNIRKVIKNKPLESEKEEKEVIEFNLHRKKQYTLEEIRLMDKVNLQVALWETYCAYLRDIKKLEVKENLSKNAHK